MATSERSIVIGVFDNPAQVDEAIDALQRAGFDRNQIRRSLEETSRPKGLKGFFSGEKTIPHETITEDLEEMGVDSEDAHLFQQEYESGHALVSVEGRGDMQPAVTLLNSLGAHGIEPTEQGRIREETTGRSARGPEAHKMQLRGERLKAYKKPGEGGEVRLRKEVVTEQQTLNVPVTHEEVVVERHPPAEGAVPVKEPLGEGEEIRIPLREEQVQISKETVATGEVEVSKRKVQEQRQFTEPVRHEEASIQKEGEAPVIDTNDKQPPIP